MEILYKTVDTYLKFHKQEKGGWKHYTKPFIIISIFTNRKRKLTSAIVVSSYTTFLQLFKRSQ